MGVFGANVSMTEASANVSPVERPLGRTLSYERILNSIFWITSFSGSIVFLEPSPCDGLILSDDVDLGRLSFAHSLLE